jgi:hypothetical protein
VHRCRYHVRVRKDVVRIIDAPAMPKPAAAAAEPASVGTGTGSGKQAAALAHALDGIRRRCGGGSGAAGMADIDLTHVLGAHPSERQGALALPRGLLLRLDGFRTAGGRTTKEQK